jgi:hypothetical protein
VSGEYKYVQALVNDFLPAFIDQANGLTDMDYSKFNATTNYETNVGPQIDNLETAVASFNASQTLETSTVLLNAINDVNDLAAQEILLAANVTIEVPTLFYNTIVDNIDEDSAPLGALVHDSGI